MKLSEELVWRGQIKDKTFDDQTWLDDPKTFYLGTDCSSGSLTVGNLAVYMLARRLLDSGWNMVLLLGGATSLIGDPGGKDQERPLKSRQEIQANVASIENQVKLLFSGQKFTLVDNYDWFKNIGFLEFLRDIGKHYSTTELLQRDFIASRIGESGSGISYAEFSYSLIQGYDYWHLFKNHGVVLQIGGSDQWGNMLSGVPLIRKKEDQEVHALSMPLVINKSTGKKFGKSEDGAVWLDSSLTSPYKFYQFWLNVDDEGVEDYLKIYTLLSKQEIENILTDFRNNPGQRLAQKTLAYEVTGLVHGQDQANKQKRVAESLFGNEELEALSEEEFQTISQELPYFEITDGENVLPIIIQGGLAASNTEARRFLQDGAIYINHEQVPPGSKTLFLNKDGTLFDYALIRRGKNTQLLVKIK